MEVDDAPHAERAEEARAEEARAEVDRNGHEEQPSTQHNGIVDCLDDEEEAAASALVLTPQQLEDELQNLRFTRPRVTHAEHGSCIVGVCVCSHASGASNQGVGLRSREGNVRWRPLIIQTDALRAPFGLKQRAGETRGMLELSLDESTATARAIRAMDAFLASSAGRWFVFRNCGTYLTQIQKSSAIDQQQHRPVRRAEDTARAATYQPIARMNNSQAQVHPPLLRVTVPPDLISQAPTSRAWVTATLQCVGVWVQDSGDGPARYGCSWKLLNVQKTARPPASPSPVQQKAAEAEGNR
jgi:hypothetical protein